MQTASEVFEELVLDEIKKYECYPIRNTRDINKYTIRALRSGTVVCDVRVLMGSYAFTASISVMVGGNSIATENVELGVSDSYQKLREMLEAALAEMPDELRRIRSWLEMESIYRIQYSRGFGMTDRIEYVETTDLDDARTMAENNVIQFNRMAQMAVVRVVVVSVRRATTDDADEALYLMDDGS